MHALERESMTETVGGMSDPSLTVLCWAGQLVLRGGLMGDGSGDRYVKLCADFRSVQLVC